MFETYPSFSLCLPLRAELYFVRFASLRSHPHPIPRSPSPLVHYKQMNASRAIFGTNFLGNCASTNVRLELALWVTFLLILSPHAKMVGHVSPFVSHLHNEGNWKRAKC